MALESRVLLSNYSVTNSNDSGAGSLRFEVGLANADGGADTITFDQTAFASHHTITLTSGQIDLNDVGGLTITAPAAGVTVSGGGLSRVFAVDTGTTADLVGLTITGGNASNGGGVDNHGGTLSLLDCTVTGNHANGRGAGIYSYGHAYTTLRSSNVSNNTATNSGGGIYTIQYSTLTLTDSTISGNDAVGGGGGGIDVTSSTLTMLNCTVSGNTAGFVVAGIYLRSASASLTNVTVANNNANAYAGGVAAFTSTATLTNCTISGNVAGLKDGGLIVGGGHLTLNNSIVARNFDGYGASDVVTFSDPIYGSYNLIGTGGSGGLVDGTSGNIVGVANPPLSALGNYGGPTQTIALLPGSLAIDAGSNALAIGTTDQRGEPYVGTVDLGAFESQGFTLTPVAGSTPQSAIHGTAFTNPLAATVTANNAVEPVEGGIITFTAPGSGASATLVGNPATIASGTASVNAVAFSTLGNYNVTATAIGVATPASFALTNAETPSLVVNTTSDLVNPTDGLTSLREAITYANTFTSSAPTITFDPTVFNSAKTITLTLGQLEVSDTATPITINALAAGLTISGNSVSRVFQVDHGATAVLNGLTITGGSTALYGGGIYDNGTASLTNCIVTGNFAKYGGGGIAVGFSGDSLTLTNTVLSNNGTTYAGGGLDAESSSTVVMTNSTVSNNSAGGGGGIFTSGSTTLTGCTFSGNTAENGGGVQLSQGSATLTNVTISGNTAATGAGLTDTYATTTLTNVTISGNSATTTAGGIYNTAAVMTLNNTIVAGNTLNSGASDFVVSMPGHIVLGSNNLFGTGGSGGLVNGVNGNQVGVVNPLLSPLGNYGGPTETIALLPGSPAINAGKTSLAIGTTDQRGEPYVGTVDIGAFESQGFALTTVAGSTPQTTIQGTAFANPLAVTVTANNAVEPINGGVVTYTVPGSGASATLVGNPTTIASGTASVNATANSTVGTYNVTATAIGAATPASFALGNFETPSLIVNATSDVVDPYDGLTSLREAIYYANTFITSAPTITFDPTVFATAQTITLTGGQLDIVDTDEPITITAPVLGVTISGKSASRVFEIYSGVTANLTGLMITGGNANRGAGLDINGTASLTNCTVSGNSASHYGGGVYVNGGGSATLTNTTVTNNSAKGDGGGVYVSGGGTVAMTNCTVSGNTAEYGGGLYSNGNVTLSDSTFNTNSSSSYGGGIYINSGNMTMTNVTVSGNTAGASGGGLEFWRGTTTLTNVTVSDNTATNGGGGTNNYYATVTLNNTIVAGNINGDIDGKNGVTGSYNLIGMGGSGGLVNGSNGNIVGVANPLLSPLGNYGGPTQTIALLPGSPAIDAGTNSLAIGTTDQRGKPYIGTVDIGAFESQGFTLAPVAGSTPQSAFHGTAFANPLAITVTANNPIEPVNGGVVTYTVPGSGASATLVGNPATIASSTASATATANSILGTYNVTANASGVTTAASFALLNFGSPAQLAFVVVPGSGTAGQVLSPALTVAVEDVYGSVLTGDSSTVTIGIASGPGSFASGSTLSVAAVKGIATFSHLILNPFGTYKLSASDGALTGATSSNVLIAAPPVLSGIETFPLAYKANDPAFPPLPISSTVAVTDLDSDNLTKLTVQITLGYQNDTNGQDVLAFTNKFGITGSFDATSGTLTLSGTAYVGAYREALRTVTFSSSGTNVSTANRILTILATDDGSPSPAVSQPITRIVTVSTTNVPPTLTGVGTAPITYAQGGPNNVAVAPSAVVSDPDSINLSGAKIQITGNYQAGQDVLAAATTGTGITQAFDTSSGTLTLSGIAALANYQAVLRTVSYHTISTTGSLAPRTATFVLNDGLANGTPVNQLINIVTYNAPPVIGGLESSPIVGKANHPPLLISNTVTVTDPDSNNLTKLTVQITSGYENDANGQDILAFTNKFGITGSFDSTSGTLTLTGTAYVGAYREALRTVTFSSTGTNVSSANRILTMIATDDGSPTAAVSQPVTQTVVFNFPPVVYGIESARLVYVANTPPLLISNTVAVTDPDSNNLTKLTIQITSGYENDTNGQDVLAFTNQFGITGSFDVTSGTLTLTGTAYVGAYREALRTVKYSSSGTNVSTADRVLTIIATDDGSPTPASSKPVTQIVTALNRPPVLAGIETSPLTYQVNSAPQAISSSVTVTDPDSENLTKLTVQITSGYQNDSNGNDVLAFANEYGITGSFDASTGTLTLTGAAYLGYYREALRSVTFLATGTSVSTANRILTIIATDDSSVPALSSPITRTVNVTTT